MLQQQNSGDYCVIKRQQTLFMHTIDMKKETVNNVEQLHLQGSVSIHRAGEIKEFLLEAMQTVNEKELVLSQATKVDVAGSQLILAWKKQLAQQGTTVKVILPADEEVKSLLEKSGISKIF